MNKEKMENGNSKNIHGALASWISGGDIELEKEIVSNPSKLKSIKKLSDLKMKKEKQKNDKKEKTKMKEQRKENKSLIIVENDKGTKNFSKSLTSLDKRQVIHTNGKKSKDDIITWAEDIKQVHPHAHSVDFINLKRELERKGDNNQMDLKIKENEISESKNKVSVEEIKEPEKKPEEIKKEEINKENNNDITNKEETQKEDMNKISTDIEEGKFKDSSTKESPKKNDEGKISVTTDENISSIQEVNIVIPIEDKKTKEISPKESPKKEINENLFDDESESMDELTSSEEYLSDDEMNTKSEIPLPQLTKNLSKMLKNNLSNIKISGKSKSNSDLLLHQSLPTSDLQNLLLKRNETTVSKKPKGKAPKINLNNSEIEDKNKDNDSQPKQTSPLTVNDPSSINKIEISNVDEKLSEDNKKLKEIEEKMKRWDNENN